MLRQIERLHEGCVRAWDEFADTIPCIVDALPDGRMGLAVNTFASQRVGPRNPDFEPTEVLLDDPSLLDDGGSHLRALIEAARAKVHVEDSLNPHFGRTRYARDCKDRDWGYRLRLACRDSAEDIVAFRPQEFSTRLLHERVVTRLIEGSATSMLDLFASYAPGGDLAGQTPNGLPPGFQALDEYKAAEDARRAALRHPDPDDDDPGP